MSQVFPSPSQCEDLGGGKIRPHALVSVALTNEPNPVTLSCSTFTNVPKTHGALFFFTIFSFRHPAASHLLYCQLKDRKPKPETSLSQAGLEQFGGKDFTVVVVHE